MRSDFDLNLLKTLVILAEKKNLKKTGISLGLTESTVSKQLARLREHLDDELFVRVAGVLEPTDYTLSILPRVNIALTDIEDALIPISFNPQNYSGSINLALPDLVMEVFGLTLYETLQREFPNALIALHNWGEETENKILSGEINLGIHLLHPDRLNGLYQQRVCGDQLVIAIAGNHGVHDWQTVKYWPFIKQKNIGWNAQRFHFIKSLKELAVEIDYLHDIDTASLALKLMRSQRVGNVLPSLILGEELIRVPGAEFLDYEVVWTTCVRLTDRRSGLYQYLYKIILTLFIGQRRGDISAKPAN